MIFYFGACDSVRVESLESTQDEVIIAILQGTATLPSRAINRAHTVIKTYEKCIITFLLFRSVSASVTY